MADRASRRPVAGSGKKAAAAAAPVPVLPGEKPWTAAELDEVRTSLEGDVERLRLQVAEAESGIADTLHGTGEGSGDDSADVGSMNFEREHEMSITNNARDLLLQSEKALTRIDAGTYGMCESCGAAIGKARLQAFPRATLDLTCKAREERR